MRLHYGYEDIRHVKKTHFVHVLCERFQVYGTEMIASMVVVNSSFRELSLISGRDIFYPPRDTSMPISVTLYLTFSRIMDL